MKQLILTLLFIFSLIELNAQIVDIITFDSDSPSEMLKKGNELFFVNSLTKKISRIDITDVTPNIVDIVKLPSNDGFIKGLAIKGDHLYFTHSYIGTGKVIISKINYTDPNSSKIDVFTFDSFFNIRQLLFNGNDLYISHFSKISKIDFTDVVPSLTEVTSDVFKDVAGMAIKGNFLYFTEKYAHTSVGPGGIWKLKITDAMPANATTVITGLTAPNYLTLRENDLYIVTQNEISKIDITDVIPIEKHILYTSDPYAIVVDENIIYFTSERKTVSKYTFLALSIDKNSLDKNIKLYPNPTNNDIQFLGLKKTESYSIYNVSGVKVFNGDINENEKIDITNFSNGVYFLKFNSGSTFKFIKK